MNYKIRNFAGFTLIELLVVIVIIGILATVSVAMFSGYFSKSELAKAQHFASTADSKLRTDLISKKLKLIADCPFDSVDSSGRIPCLTGFSMDGVTLISDTFDGSGKSAKGWSGGNLSRKRLSNGITFSAWLKRNGEYSFPEALVQTSDLFRMRFHFSTDHLGVPELEIRGKNGSELWLQGPGLDIDTWNHFLGTCDESEIKFYVNGELVSIKDASGITLPKSVSHVSVSGDYVDELRVYPLPLVGVMPRSSSKTRTIADGGDDFDLS